MSADVQQAFAWRAHRCTGSAQHPSSGRGSTCELGCTRVTVAVTTGSNDASRSHTPKNISVRNVFLVPYRLWDVGPPPRGESSPCTPVILQPTGMLSCIASCPVSPSRMGCPVNDEWCKLCAVKALC